MLKRKAQTHCAGNREMQQHLNQMLQEAPTKHQSLSIGANPGSSSTCGVRRIIFPRRSSLSKAASRLILSTKESNPQGGKECDRRSMFVASAAGTDPATSSPLSRSRPPLLKSCLSTSTCTSASSLQSSSFSSFSSLDCYNSAMSSDEGRSPTKSVSFDKVQVREYEITKGCTTMCISSGGPPISLSWFYNPMEKNICVDQYEKYRAERRRRSSRELILSPRERVVMIQHQHADV